MNVTSEHKCETRSKLTQRAAARVLGCTYQHLSATIMGKRQSASLSARYRDLLERHDAGQLIEREAAALREFQIIVRASKVLGVFPEHLISVPGGQMPRCLAGQAVSRLGGFVLRARPDALHDFPTNTET